MQPIIGKRPSDPSQERTGQLTSTKFKGVQCYSFLDKIIREMANVTFSVTVEGTQMGPMLVLVSSCFIENVNVICKIMSFMCSLDNFLLKNVIIIVFFFGNQISKWGSLEKKGYF